MVADQLSEEAVELVVGAYKNYRHLTVLKPEGRVLRFVAGTEVFAPEDEEKAQSFKRVMENELLNEGYMKKGQEDTINLTQKGCEAAENLIKLEGEGAESRV
ncbi:hypothetical protein [Halarsenatibacter silvermanii]|uniref:Uncharacterized protein n=1 Tax=Halarsenatibacter silvermanii TaxID=321763 RepID=A0A1G9QV88_9FIRM|nr:hypothetical protein [Halarsenatibacter silvermanii]SDM14904.1 hypothetical protein SAMN04488692_11841 [Halarsenatibacter silvermanii]